jgi:hypothetical protein
MHARRESVYEREGRTRQRSVKTGSDDNSDATSYVL